MLGQVPYLVLSICVSASARGIELVEQLNSTSDTNVHVQDVVSAQDTVDSICALRAKRVQALREVLVSDTKDPVGLTLTGYLLGVSYSQIERVPLQCRTVILRVQNKCVFLFAHVRAHKDVLHGLPVTAFIHRLATSLKLCEVASALHRYDISNSSHIAMDIVGGLDGLAKYLIDDILHELCPIHLLITVHVHLLE